MEIIPELSFTNRYAVRISTDDGKELKGSGTLCIKKQGECALVITAAHVIDRILESQGKMEGKPITIYMTFTDDNHQYRTMYLDIRIKQKRNFGKKEAGDVYIHPRYDDVNLIYDIAAIFIPWQDWMKSMPMYRIESYRVSALQYGWGFPASGNKEWEKDCENEIAGKNSLKACAEEYGKKGYHITYYVEMSDGRINRDDFAMGLSGTGLFEKRGGVYCLVGIVSQPYGEDASGYKSWVSKATWIYDIDDELEVLQGENEELLQLVDFLTQYCNKCIALACNSTINLKNIESSLCADLVDEYSQEFESNKYTTALFEKLKSLEEKEYSKNRHLILIGEGGIGKTATMLGCAKTLLEERKPVIYIPLRAVGDGDTLDSFIFREILLNENNLKQYVETLRYRKNIKYKRVFLFLDGFNELRETQRNTIIEEIGKWSVDDNIQIVISSRRTLEEDGNCGFLAQRITMKRLKWEKVTAYLKSKKIKIPDQEKMSEILGIPLMLKLYTEIQNDKKRNLFIVNSNLYKWKSDMTSSGNILWNYIQCQIFNAEYLRESNREEDYTFLDFIVAAEYLAPFVACKMNSEKCYSTEEIQVVNWIREGIELLQASPEIERISSVKRHKNLFRWSKNSLDANVIFYLLVYKLNLLVCTKENEMSFEHQDFQDILHYIYVEDSMKYPTYKFYLGALTNSKLPYDLITLMSEFMKKEEIDTVWKKFKNEQTLSGDYGIYNIIEVFKRLKQNNLSDFNFSGIDLKNVKLSGTILASTEFRAVFRNAEIGERTFLSIGHDAPVTCVDFSSTGGKFVSASYDKTLRIWNTETGEFLKELRGHIHYVRCVAWSPNEELIVSGGDDTNLIVWDVYAHLNNAVSPPIILKRHTGWIYSVAWSCDGRSIASGDSEGNVYIWQVDKDRQISLHKRNSEYKSCVRCLKWSPIAPDILAIGYENGMLQIWNTDRNEQKVLLGLSETVRSIAWFVDGKKMAIASGKQIYIWDVNEILKNRKKIEWSWGQNEYSCALIQESNDIISSVICGENFIAFTDYKNICIGIIPFAYVWKKDSLNIRRMEGHTGYINCIAWSKELNTIISGAEDSTIRIWKPRNPEWNNAWSCVRFIEGNGLPARCVAWSPDNKLLIAGYDDNKLRKWNIKKERCCMVFKGHEKRVKSVDWVGNNIVSGANDNTVRVWDAETGKCKAMMLKHKGAVNCVMWLPDGKRVVSGSDDKNLYIWNFETDESIPLIGHTDSVYCVDLSADGEILVSGSQDSTLRFWSVKDGRCLEEKTIYSNIINSHRMPIRGVAWSPDMNFPMVVSASNDQTLRRWNVESNSAWADQPILYGHEDYVYCISWNPKGTYIVSGSTDNTLWIWNAITGERIFHMEEHTNYVPGVAWSPNGKYIASASCDGKICVWNVVDMLNIKVEKKFVALPFVDIVDCDFRGAIFESEKVKEKIRMNGGIVEIK